MEKDPANDLTYLIKIHVDQLDHLGQVRHWTNLRIAKDAKHYWVSGFTEEQIEDVALKSIPFIEVFYTRENGLFPYGSKLPIAKAPSFLWSPIVKGLPISKHDWNHNYFDVDGKIDIKVVQSDNEQEAVAMKVSMHILKAYLDTAPAIRLQHLSWVILDSKHALVYGAPLLPIAGEAYWERASFLLPTGYDLELHILAETVSKAVNQEVENWIFWQKDENYSLINKDLFKPLSLSSFRLSNHLIKT
ncbi:MAG: hypothetical protein AAFX87_11805 [Bacteroidota bacterium]